MRHTSWRWTSDFFQFSRRSRERVFVCTIAHSAGTHNNTAQTTASFGSSVKSAAASATAEVFVNPVVAAGADQSRVQLERLTQFSLDATAGSTIPAGGSVLWTGTGITFGSPTSLTTTATVSAFGAYTATLTIKSDDDQGPWVSRWCGYCKPDPESRIRLPMLERIKVPVRILRRTSSTSWERELFRLELRYSGQAPG